MILTGEQHICNRKSKSESDPNGCNSNAASPPFPHCCSAGCTCNVAVDVPQEAADHSAATRHVDGIVEPDLAREPRNGPPAMERENGVGGFQASG